MNVKSQINKNIVVSEVVVLSSHQSRMAEHEFDRLMADVKLLPEHEKEMCIRYLESLKVTPK